MKGSRIADILQAFYHVEQDTKNVFLETPTKKIFRGMRNINLVPQPSNHNILFTAKVYRDLQGD